MQKHNSYINIFLLVLLGVFHPNAYAVNDTTFDQQRPDHVTNKKWKSLKEAVLEAKLLPTSIGGQFGISVSLVGDRALIGAYRDDANGRDSGSAYIFDLTAGVWSQTSKLIASDASEFVQFGVSVSLSGDRALIGANYDGIGGSAYVFDLTSGVWSQTSKLTAEDAGIGDNFGFSVSLSGDRALIGAHNNNDAGSSSGSAYIFDLTGGVWSQTSKLTAIDANFLDQFGISVSLSGDRALIGAHNDDDSASFAGSAYVFDLTTNVWSQTSKLTANDGDVNDRFGISVSLSGDRALIGAQYDNDNGSGSGSAYVFDLTAGVWSQTSKLTAEDAEAEDSFGFSVSLSGNRALIGAYRDDDNGNLSGSAYIFDLTGGVWSQTNKLTAADGTGNDRFGISVSLSGDRALIGAHLDDNNGNGFGSAYIYNSNLFSIGGNVTGLATGNTVELENNTTDRMSFANGVFSFATELVNGTDYDVKVFNSPTTPNQTCVITGGSNNDGTGTLSGADVTDINVNCTTNTYSIGGTVSGLTTGNTVVLQSNTGEELTINRKGGFTFLSPLNDESPYMVSILTQSAGQVCQLSNESGILAGNNVNNITLTCVTQSLILDTSLLDFEQVFVGNTQTAVITVINNGTVDVSVTGINPPTLPFSISGGSCQAFPVVLTAGNSCTIEVSFNPIAEGTFNDTLDVLSSVASSPNIVSVSGGSTIQIIPVLNTWTLMLMILIMILLAFRTNLRVKLIGTV